MIFNGGKNRIDGNLCFSEFYELLQKYYNSKLRGEQGLNKIENQSIEQTFLDC